jgi:CHAT domain-containing protein
MLSAVQGVWALQMSSKKWVVALGALSLAACAPKSVTPNGAVILDETVTLSRGAKEDSAQREFVVDSKALLVAIVDENLADVRVTLSPVSSFRTPARSVEVENNLGGLGPEIAALEVPRGRVVVALSGPQTGTRAGQVRVRILQYEHGAVRDPRFRDHLDGMLAWSAATHAAFRGDTVKAEGLPHIDRAIASLERSPADASLAAQARLVRANLLQYFDLDWREARAEALRAARAFATLPRPDEIGVARAWQVEATALHGMSLDLSLKNPTSAEATAQAREILGRLTAEHSPLGPVERARALATLGNIDLNATKLDDAKSSFEKAKALFDATGYESGSIEMQACLALVLAEWGRRFEAAQEFAKVVPHVDRIVNVGKRIDVLNNAAAAESFSGLTDAALEHLHMSRALAHEYRLPRSESRSLQILGYLYFYRGDTLQAKTLLAESLRIARLQQDTMVLVGSLQAGGVVARYDGDIDYAIELHQEGVARSSNPIFRMRTQRHLALNYIAAGRYEDAIRELRGSLAVELPDQNHYAYSDVRRDLAEMLIAHGDGSKATLAEAEWLANRAMQQSTGVKDRLGQIGAHRVLAMLQASKGNLDAARTEYDRAFALLFAYRAGTVNPQFRLVTLDHEVATFRAYFDLSMREVAAGKVTRPRPATAEEEGTLRLLERAREAHAGAVYLEKLDDSTAARVDALLAEMGEKSLKIATMLKQPAQSQSAELAALQMEMSNLRTELDRERTAAAEKQAALQQHAAVVARSWRPAAPGTTQLSYALGNEHAYVWVRDAAGIRVAMLGESPAVIEKKLAEFAVLDRQKNPDKVEQALAQMSSVLIPPGLLPVDSTALEIVAEGRIASVPFAGLRSPGAGARRLVETHAIKMISSLFAVGEPARPRQARPFRLVALASGSGTLRSAPLANPAPKLQAAVAEINAVRDLFEAREPEAKVKLLTGREGSAATLRGIWSSGADVVHFATHALADLRQPLASLLVLPAHDNSGAPTYLTAGQIEGWRGDADLVFLSACESAIGPPRFAGGMPGLQSAFLRAGARGVIATLWPIEDVMAREFAEDFYQRFTNGQSPVDALSQTQREWLAERPDLSEADQMRRRITAMAHAFFAT